MNERTRAIISSAVVLAANILAMYGVSVDTEVWVNGICAAVMLVSTCWALWKNHNFTDEAAKAQAYLDELKAAKKEAPEETSDKPEEE